ncbi:hypothetical protein R6Q57_023734 [Mikania cordata]
MEVDDGNDQLSGEFHEFAAGVGASSDLDFAFQLQMQEAITASLKPSSSSSANVEIFNVYFKGLVSNETVSNVRMSFAGIGAAICDANGRCVFESRKSFLLDAGGRGIEGDLVELEALMEALDVAVNLELKRVHILCDNDSVYQYLTGKDRPTNKTAVTLVDALILIQKKIGYHIRNPSLARQKNVKFAKALAKTATDSKETKPAKSTQEQCTICLKCVTKSKMFSVKQCLHRYCCLCMNEHVKSKLHQCQMLKCPHEQCSSKLEIESCKEFLTKELYDIMSSRIKEASIVPSERVYCPFSKCSALMSKTELQHAASTSSRVDGKRKCVECHRSFCINCKVPWHYKSTCSNYMKDFPDQIADEVQLKSLATSNHWRRCVNCMHMIELAAGCYHITCRCGYEFCYRCGAVREKKKATCSCPTWNLNHIIYDAR